MRRGLGWLIALSGVAMLALGAAHFCGVDGVPFISTPPSDTPTPSLDAKIIAVLGVLYLAAGIGLLRRVKVLYYLAVALFLLNLVGDLTLALQRGISLGLGVMTSIHLFVLALFWLIRGELALGDKVKKRTTKDGRRTTT